MLTSGVAGAQVIAAMEHSPIGTALVGLDGRWRWTNGAIRTILGYSLEEFAALDFQRMTHCDDLAADIEQVGKLIAGEGSACQIEKRYLRKDGRTRWCRQTVSLIRDDDGAPDYFLWKVQDLSHGRADGIERTALTERRQLATRVGGVGVWEWDVATDRLIWDDRMFELYDIPMSIKPDFLLFLDAVDCGHRERIDLLFRNALRDTAVYQTEFPITTVGGEVRHIRATATAVRDASGAATRMIGTNWDISAERRPIRSPGRTTSFARRPVGRRYATPL